MIRVRPLIALCLSLLLLFGQQAALAHMIGHVGAGGAGSTANVFDKGDDGHGEALTLSHACTTCVSASALAGLAPLVAPAVPHFDGRFGEPMPVLNVAFAGSRRSFHLARAPPAVL